jgi:lipoyl(octanoyl) transferase
MSLGPLTAESREMVSKRSVDIFDLGSCHDYLKVWNLQKKLVAERIDGRSPDSVILVEHDHVLTLGRSSHLENVLVKDLPVFEIERGGDVTYHGPGQLVVYPILSLQELGLGVRQYVELLEAVIVDALTPFGIAARGELGKLTGVWVGANKIASIGIATSHWVTYHGFALNVNTDLSYFGKINPCGFESSIMTSISKELGTTSVGLEKVKKYIVDAFSMRFGFELRPVEKTIDQQLV